MIWREMINKSCLIGYCANIKKDVAGGSVVLQEQPNPKMPEGTVIFALKLFKASAVPDVGSKERKYKGEIKNMKNKGMQLGAMLATMLILMATIFVPVAMASESTTSNADENKTSGCTGCSKGNGSCSVGVAGNKTELQGAEKDKVLDMAFDNKEIKKLQAQLEAEGFQKKSDKVYTVPVKAEDDTVVDVQVAMMVFESSNGEVKQINFAHNKKTGDTVVALGAWQCVECAAILIGGGYACGTICVTLGVLTLGAACVACLVGGAIAAQCPCYSCCCAAGYGSCCTVENAICP
jgi:hypothetical protein